MTRRGVIASLVAMQSAPALARLSDPMPRMSYFPADAHAALRSNPAAIISIYNAHRDRFVADLGAGFAKEVEDHVKLGFCGLVAYDLTPYGPHGGNAAVPVPSLYNVASMDCDNYAAVTWRLFNILCPASSVSVAAVGWDGGPIGNHAQIFSSHPSGTAWLVDPTIGVVQCEYDFDWIASGRPTPEGHRKDFYWRAGDAVQWLHDRVIEALDKGEYRPSQLLYYATTIDKFLDAAPMGKWMTPRA
ncbi:MAG TPA: hypothetical protein VH743_05130 [Beijerinckiaceae bacterium]|jgi:hypothetical protein